MMNKYSIQLSELAFLHEFKDGRTIVTNDINLAEIINGSKTTTARLRFYRALYPKAKKIKR